MIEIHRHGDKFIIVRIVQQVFNYAYTDFADAQRVKAKLEANPDPLVSANWQDFTFSEDLALGGSTRGTACNHDPNVEAWFVHKK
jgi:hypothetical protein